MRTLLEAFAGQLIGATKAGLSLRDACRAVGVSENTARGWLKRGRQEQEGAYAEFAAAMDAARTQQPSSEPMAEEELTVLAWRAARRGSVPAMVLCRRLLKEEGSSKPRDPLSAVDELAARRQAANGTSA